MRIEFELSPEKEGDESKVAFSFSEDGSANLKIYDCNEHTSHMIRKGEVGRNKIRRLQLALELILKHNFDKDETLRIKD